MFPVGFPVFTTCGAPQAECTVAQPRKTTAICAPIEFKPHNPPILWKEVGIKYPPVLPYLVSPWVWKGIWYLYGSHVSMFLEFGSPVGSFSSQFWYPYGSKFFAWSAHPYPPPEEDPPPPPPPPPGLKLQQSTSTKAPIKAPIKTSHIQVVSRTYVQILADNVNMCTLVHSCKSL